MEEIKPLAIIRKIPIRLQLMQDIKNLELSIKGMPEQKDPSLVETVTMAMK